MMIGEKLEIVKAQVPSHGGNLQTDNQRHVGLEADELVDIHRVEQPEHFAQHADHQ